MEKKQVRIDQGRVIPLFPRLLVSGVIVALLIKLMDQSPTPDLRFIVSIIIGSTFIYALWSTRQVIYVDQNKQLIQHFYWLMGIRIKPQEEPGNGTKILLRRLKNRQKSQGRHPWKIHLKLENGTEVFLISRDNREDGEKVAQSIAKKLGLEVKEA